jgi:hypothetical protein
MWWPEITVVLWSGSGCGFAQTLHCKAAACCKAGSVCCSLHWVWVRPPAGDLRRQLFELRDGMSGNVKASKVGQGPRVGGGEAGVGLRLLLHWQTANRARTCLGCSCFRHNLLFMRRGFLSRVVQSLHAGLAGGTGEELEPLVSLFRIARKSPGSRH